MVLEDVATAEIKEFILPPSSGALIKCGNELIMYERDNKPNISNPGKLAIIGGVVETPLGETEEDALIREIKEELTIEVGKDQIKYLGRLEAGDDQTHTKHISLVEITPEQKSLIQKGEEGKELKYFTQDNLPDENDLVPDLKGFFVDHKGKLVNWLQGEEINASDLGLKE